MILISNQPGIARGNLTEEGLQEIHDKMERDLEEVGAHVDKIYYCPHNWDDGCFCRKPKPGMLYQAQRDFSLNLPTGYLVGDDERDIEAGESARVKSILVSEDNPLSIVVDQIIKGEL